MKILFCDNGFSPKEVDYMYAEEQEAAKAMGFETFLISFEELTKRKNLDLALRNIRPQDDLQTAIYRGWMLSPADYEFLYNGLLKLGLGLINDPASYKFCHYLPENYPTLIKYTPFSAWKPVKGDFNISDFDVLLDQFGDQPIIIKDYVKSQKHYWEEACYVSSAANRAEVERKTKRFLELQAEDLNEGIVYRKFVELEQLSKHSKSGMPLTKEFRLVIKDGKLRIWFNYWEEGDYENLQPPIEQFLALLPQIKSRFYTMDIAKTVAGDWLIVELGDGQVSGLPDNADKKAYYQAIMD